MKNNRVLITTSGLGNRLGNVTKYTNKSLVRLGKVAALTRIINHYSDDTEFVITVGYYGNLVKQYLQLAHPHRIIKFVEINKYEGEGSSLLYSMYRAKDHLQCPFIFHACDSVITDTSELPSGNVCLTAWSEDNSQYRTIVCNSDNIIKIEDKGSLLNKSAHIGVVKIEDYDAFWNCAGSLLADFPKDTSLSDCHVIECMLGSGYRFEAHTVESWYDIGNSRSLAIAKQHFEEQDNFKILDKEEENIFIFDDFVIKFFHDKNIVANRVKRVDHLKGYGPKLLDHTENYYKYEFVEGELASHNNDVDLFYNLLVDLRHNYWTSVDVDPKFNEQTYKFYFEKTKDRVNQFYKQRNVKYDKLTINHRQIESFDVLMNKIPKNLLCTDNTTYFHGDFVLDNLLVKDNKFKFLDWRQDFCGNIKGGDMYYDLAKMNHSLHFDHGLVANNNFVVYEQNGQVRIELLCKLTSIYKKHKFDKFLLDSGYNVDKVNILTSIIWLNMSPLHVYPLNKFLYYLGMYTLQSTLDEL